MNTSFIFGKLTLDALPFYSPVAFAGASLIVVGGIAVVALITWLKAWGYLWREWLTTTDHKKIGIMYVILAMIMLLRGFVDALMMRAQQAIAMNAEGYLTPDHFQQIFSSHGTIMVFFMGMPFLFGIMNYVVPLQLGSRDVAFPLLNSISLWLTAAGRGAGHGLPRHRRLLDRRLDRLSALHRAQLQPRRRRRLLDHGARRERHRHDAQRRQLHRHDLQAQGARHDPDAHAAVLLDGAVRQPARHFRHTGPDRCRRAARPRPLPGDALLHQ